MSIGKSLITGLVLLFAAASMVNGDATKQARVPGFYDLLTQTFTALAASDQNVELAPDNSPQAVVAARQGEMQLTATISLQSPSPSDAVTATGAIYVRNSDHTLINAAGGNATVDRNGTVATITVRFPYWVQVDATSSVEATVRVYRKGSSRPGVILTQHLAVPANRATTRLAFKGSI